MSNSRLNQRAIFSSLILLNLFSSMPVQAQSFANFNSASFNQVKTTFSPTPTRAQVAGSIGTNVINTAAVAPLSSSIPLSPAISPTMGTVVVSPTTAVLSPSFSPMMVAPVVGNFSQTMTQGTLVSNQINTVKTPVGGFGANLPGNIVGTFGSVANSVSGGMGGIKNPGVFGTVSGTPFHNISIQSAAAPVKLGAIAPAARNFSEQVSQVRNHNHGGIGQLIKEELKDAPGAGVSAIASLVGDDDEHRPGETPIVPGLPGSVPTGSGLAGTVGAVTNLIVSVQQQSQLTLFSSTNQVLQGARGQVFSGDPGTLLSHQHDTIILHKGRLAVDSGKESTIVKTSKGEVKLSPNAIAIIDNQVGKPLQILALQGNDNAVSLSGPATRGIEVTARAGEQLIVSNDDEMIPAEGSDAVISGGVEVRASVKKAEISVADVVDEYHRRAGKMARFAGLSGHPSDSTTAIARSRQLNGDKWNLFGEKASTPMQVVAQAGAQFQQDENGNIKLLYGSLFLAAKANCKISTAFGSVELKRNGVSMIDADEKICRIKSFSGPDDLLVVSGSSKYDLAPGQELLIAKQAPSDVEVIPADAIARRTRTKTQLVEGNHFMINDFSICSMLRYPGYRKMISESDRSGKLADKILKTAVVVEMVTRVHGQYAYSSLYQQNAKQQLSSSTTKESASR